MKRGDVFTIGTVKIVIHGHGILSLREDNDVITLTTEEQKKLVKFLQEKLAEEE